MADSPVQTFSMASLSLTLARALSSKCAIADQNTELKLKLIFCGVLNLKKKKKASW